MKKIQEQVLRTRTFDPRSWLRYGKRHLEAFEGAYRNSIAKGVPDISCYSAQGKLLAVQA